MDSVRSPSSIIICLCIQLSARLLGPSTAASASHSLWGKKVVFDGRTCVWQLEPEVAVPALEELSVCVLLNRSIGSVWTGFAYKAPGGTHIELGLEGDNTQLVAWLFGKEWLVTKGLTLYEWHSVCLTWSSQAQRLRLYINGTNQLDASVNSSLPRRLAQNGTLTLGVSHNVANGKLQIENGKTLFGEIGLFRIWAREWSAEELGTPSCADGDVVSWDVRQWNYSCTLQPDSTLQCAWSIYKIKMWTFIAYSTKPVNRTVSLEEVTRNWLESIFLPHISVHDISVSSLSQTCHVVNNSAAPHIQQAQGSKASQNTFDKCFSSEFYVSVSPAADVGVVQANITELLNLTFSYDFLNLTVDPNSLSIQPVESFPLVTKPPPTASTGATISETCPTHSLPASPTNMSTTREPLDVNDTVAVRPDTFFRVNLTLSMTATPKPKDIIESWLKGKLEVNKTMNVLNLKIKEKDSRNIGQYKGLMTSHMQNKEYECSFHVQEYNSLSANETEKLIRDTLTSKYENGTVVIQTIDMVIKHIVPENCRENTTLTIYGPFTWPEAFPQETQEMGCKDPPSGRAYRLCELNSDTDATDWADPDMTACKPLVTISDLDKINVTAGNAAEVVDMIQDLIDVEFGSAAVGEGELSASQLDTVMEKLDAVVDISVVTRALGAEIINIIADILVSKSDITPVANSVLNLTERLGDNMEFQGESASLTAPSLGFSMINVDPDKFRGLTFGVSSLSSGLDPKIFVNQNFVSEPFPDTVATISLPSALHDFFPPGDRNRTRVQFQFYGVQDLFKDPDTTITTEGNWTLNTYIVSASINNSHVSNLKHQRVVVTLSHQNPKEQKDKVQCVFWDFQKNGGQGGWNGNGCETLSISANQTSCLCDHLTHFGVLLDVDRAPISEADSQILTVISYLGCGISSIFLGVTLLTYLAFEKLRRDYPSKILINLSVALLGLNMLFLLDSWLSSFPSYGLCIVTAATLHYFLLASFAWMGLEAVHMYFALVKVFNVYVPSYILKFCAVGWGIPLVIISLVLAIDKDAYGSALPQDAGVVLQDSQPFCWLQSDVFFYVTVVPFVLLVLLCNISVFIVVLIQIRQMRTNKPSANSHGSLHDLRAVASLTVLLGLTWPVAFFAWGPARVALLYMFTILNSLQGLFVFVFHCLMKENVRKQWRIHLCCGRFRLSDHSDWSRSVTVGGRVKQKQLVNSASNGSVDTSSIRKVSDSSTGSAPNHHQGE